MYNIREIYICIIYALSLTHICVSGKQFCQKCKFKIPYKRDFQYLEH